MKRRLHTFQQYAIMLLPSKVIGKENFASDMLPGKLRPEGDLTLQVFDALPWCRRDGVHAVVQISYWLIELEPAVKPPIELLPIPVSHTQPWQPE